MGKGRIEAFSDAVLAIIITITVLELKVPHGSELSALKELIPVFLSYILSFAYIAIYWNNHHHLFHVVHKVNGNVLWANVHLLFWLSLLPFVTGWMGENHFAPMPVAIYGVVLLMAGFAYYILARILVSIHGSDSDIAIALGKDYKGRISLIIYLLAVIISFFNSWLAFVMYVIVAIIWIIPDQRIEKKLLK